MRVSLHIDPELYSKVERMAKRHGRTVDQVVEEALREFLVNHGPESEAKRFRLPTFCGSGLRPGVDLEDSAGLLDRMEGRNGES